MQKTIKTLRMAGIVGVSSLLGMTATSAFAVDIDAEATVQNALTVTEVAPMNLGTLFATAGSTTAYSHLSLNPNTGVVDDGTQTAGYPLISLGGATRAQARVTIGTDAVFTVTLPNAVTDAALDGTTAAAYTTLGGAPVTLTHSSGNPGVAAIELVNFSINVPAASGVLNTAGCGVGAVAAFECVVDPAFGVTDFDFFIGAEIKTEEVDEQYQAGTYSGTFEVTASY